MTGKSRLVRREPSAERGNPCPLESAGRADQRDEMRESLRQPNGTHVANFRHRPVGGTMS